MWTFLWMVACQHPPASVPVEADADTDADADADADADTDADSDADTDTEEPPCVDDATFFADDAFPVLVAECAACHNPDPESFAHSAGWTVDQADVAATRASIEAFVLAEPDNALAFTERPTNERPHAGGLAVDFQSGEHLVLLDLVQRIQNPDACLPAVEGVDCLDGTPRPGPSHLRRLTDVQVAHSIADALGVTVDAGLFPPTARNADFRTFAVNNTISAADTEFVLLAAEQAAERADIAALQACQPAETPETCARRWGVELATSLYRRPLDLDEERIVHTFLDAGVAPELASRMTIELLLQSPQFLYLSDRTQPGSTALDDYAVAARVAYFLTDSPPDATLWAAAEAGELRTRTQIRDQAVRLLTDMRAVGVIQRFHEDWLDLYQLDNATRDPALYPDFDDTLRSALYQEAALFTGEVVWSGEGTYDALMLSTWGWVDPELAPIYDLPAPVVWQPFELGVQRPGILTRPSFLAAHAYEASSSPVRRGAWALHNLLCEDLAPPDNVDMDLSDGVFDPTANIRERLAAHTTDPSCRSCHDKIDPIGFSLENFDALGAWRDTWENGETVDAEGSLNGATFPGAPGMLQHVLVDDPVLSVRARECYAERWFEYAVGRQAGMDDHCTLDQLGDRFLASGGNIRALLVDLTMSDAFRFQGTP